MSDIKRIWLHGEKCPEREQWYGALSAEWYNEEDPPECIVGHGCGDFDLVPVSRVSVEAIAPIIKAEIDWGTHGIITPDCVDIALAAARSVVAWINEGVD
ncbi:MAG: hypothetical protein ABIJ75_10565 [Actinomycetota bacterium]